MGAAVAATAGNTEDVLLTLPARFAIASAVAAATATTAAASAITAEAATATTTAAATITAEAATATTTAAATITAEAATAILAGFGFVDFQCTATNFFAVELFDGRIGLVRRRHFHEGESA